ncbi:MAG: phosphatase PAP2 family protein [bacterium]
MSAIASFINSVDAQVAAFIHGITVRSWVEVASVATGFGSVPVICFLTAFTVAALILVRRYKDTWVIICSTLLSVVVVEASKHLIGRPRPINAWYLEDGYSFPSGHTTVSATFFFALAIILSRAAKARNRGIYVLGCIVATLTIGFTRLYLGVHNFTDVFAGYVLALICVGAVYQLPWVKSAKNHNGNMEGERKLIAFASIAVFLAALMVAWLFRPVLR